MDPFRKHAVKLISLAREGDATAGWELTQLLPSALVANIHSPELFEHAHRFFGSLLDVRSRLGRSRPGGLVTARSLGPPLATLGIVSRKGRPPPAPPTIRHAVPPMAVLPDRRLSRRGMNLGHRLGIGHEAYHRRAVRSIREGDEVHRERRKTEARTVAVACWELMGTFEYAAARRKYRVATADVRMEVRALVRTPDAATAKRARDVGRLAQSGQIGGSIEAGWALVDCLARALEWRIGWGRSRNEAPLAEGRPWIVQLAPTLFGHAASFFRQLSILGAQKQRWTARELIDAGALAPLGIVQRKVGRPGNADDEVVQALAAIRHLRLLGLSVLQAQGEVEDCLKARSAIRRLTRVRDLHVGHPLEVYLVTLLTDAECAALAADLLGERRL